MSTNDEGEMIGRMLEGGQGVCPKGGKPYTRGERRATPFPPKRTTMIERAVPLVPQERLTSKDTNPKDAVGIRKWRQFTTVPWTVMCEVGVAMMEGARKYGRHNYRVAGVRASVYVDAAMGHIVQWWEGEDKDPDTGLSHVTKAIASLVVLRDSMINDMMEDDRPPRPNLDATRENLQEVVDAMFEAHPAPKDAYTIKDALE